MFTEIPENPLIFLSWVTALGLFLSLTEATLKIKEGSDKDFEKIASKLVEQVNANEEGVIYYDLYKDDETTSSPLDVILN